MMFFCERLGLLYINLKGKEIGAKQWPKIAFLLEEERYEEGCTASMDAPCQHKNLAAFRP